MTDHKPVPVPAGITRAFWEGCIHGAFHYQRCATCGGRQFPPRAFCKACHDADLTWERASGRGKIHSFTVVHRPPLESFKADIPYVIAIVDLEEGVRAMMNVRDIDPAHVAIGMKVELFFEPTRDGAPPLPQARPAN
jgi:uncharacterized OB-fold protein